MRHSRRGTRVAALGAAAAVIFAGLAVSSPGSALALPALGAPALDSLSPDDGVIAEKNLELTWQPVEGATSYTIQILDDDNEDLAVIEQGTSNFNRWTAPVQLPHGEYRWRVRAQRGTVAGAWTDMATLVRGWEDQVSGLSAKGGLVPTFTWQPLPDASFYEIEVNRRPFTDGNYSRSDSFVCYTQQTTFSPYAVSLGASFDKAPGDMSSCAATSASKAVATDQQYAIGDTYYWRVRGRDGAYDERPTAFPASPGACVRPWVASGITVDSEGAVTVDLPVQAPTATAAPECSAWSTPETFTSTWGGVTIGDIPAPENLAAGPLMGTGSTRVTADPTFSWDPSPAALKYRFYLSRDRLINSVDLAAETEATSLTPVAGLGLTSTNRYWAVQACGVRTTAATDTKDPATDNDCGDISEPQPISQVTANPTAPTEFTSEDGYLLAAWHTYSELDGVPARSQARGFDVALKNLDTGTETVTRTDRVAFNGDGATSSYVLPSAGLAEGTYAFRIRTVNQAGRVTAWSRPSPSEVVDRSNPTVKLASGSGVNGRTPVTLTFSEPVTGATSATVGVRDGMGKVTGSVTVLSPTSARFTPSSPWMTGGYLSAWTAAGVKDRAAKSVSVISTAWRTRTTADSADAAITFTRGDRDWTTRTASGALGRSYRSTVDSASTAQRATASVLVYGTSIAVGVCKSPDSGSLWVDVDGKVLKKVSLYRSWTGCDASVSVSGLSKAPHRIKLIAVADGRRGTVSVDRVSVA
ncbi:MAG TPA: hypothetical protein VKB14_16895 [Actinomycetales bacterium]|nr:hypothetical protein [Actinomycetales bacterium]